MKVNTSIPVHFETVEELDSRFQRVKIWLMHLGKNYNNSIFEKDAVVDAMGTLKNTPILGYIEENMVGDKDFRGHEIELVVENGEVKTKYIGSAFGVIPENCNPRFEFKEGDTGEMLEYLVVDGLLWTKFDDAISILSESGEVSQSMELFEEYDGYWDDEGYFHFTKFSFYGACMLGKDVLPAMQKASVEMFSANVIQKEIANKLQEFSRLISRNHSKEVEHEMTLEELLEKYELTKEDLEAKDINLEDYSVEDLEAKIKEVFNDGQDGDDSDNQDDDTNQPQEDNDIDGDNDDNKDDVDEDDDDNSDDNSDDGDSDDNNNDDDTRFQADGDNKTDVEDKFTVEFELSHEDIRSQMWERIDAHMSEKGFEHDWYYIVSVFDDNVIVENEVGNKFYKVEYNKDNDEITFGEVVEVHPMWLTSEEKGALELMRNNYKTLEAENSQLQEFKKNALKAQHEAEAEELFSQFSKLDEEDYKDIKDNVHDFTIEEIESKLYEILGRKTVKFSRKEKDTSAKIKLNIDQDVSPNGGYNHLFTKYGVKPKE